MKLLKQILMVAVIASALIEPGFGSGNEWDQPATELAARVADIMGPGEAGLTIQNISSTSTDQIPVIRRVLTEQLRAHGIGVAGAESANAVRVTLSENARERLWVAEVIEGDQTSVAIVELPPAAKTQAIASGKIELHKEVLLSSARLSLGSPTGSFQSLAAFEANGHLIVVKPDEAAIFDLAAGDKSERDLTFDLKRPLPRDPRAMLISQPDGSGFTVLLGGNQCEANFMSSSLVGNNSRPINCRENDDPWPLESIGASPGATAVKGFFNASRDYFTGVVTPSLGVDLPPFYAAALVPRPGTGTGLLMIGIDGKVQLAENGALHAVAGTRDWGSEVAALQSGCGSGTQLIVSGSGSSAADSLRAYELVSSDAAQASEPLEFPGSVTALNTATDGKSVFAIVHSADNQYEVDRVTALCN